MAPQQPPQQLPPLDPAFLPFVRTDRYGEGGWVLPAWERGRLALLAATLLPLRLVLCLACVACYYVTCVAVAVVPHELAARRIVTAAGKVWSRACLFCCGFVHISWTRLSGDAAGASSAGRQHAAKRRSVAVVSNHMSWADILIHMARYLPAFVARDGTQHLPMIGLISQRMQCIFVDRERKGATAGGSSSTGTGTGSTAGAAASSGTNGAAAAGGQEQLGVSGQVRRRMLLTQERPELELRLMLLFPEGTTTNGRYLLPFKTGAFLAGVPVLPTIIHYRAGGAADPSSSSSSSSSSQARALAAAAVAAAGGAGVAAAAAAGCGGGGAAAAAVAAAAAAAVLVTGALSGKGGVSPCWEAIDATRHLLLMLCQPFHTVECYELPVYQPSPEEQADPRLYAANVRDYMLRHSAAVMGRAALQPSSGLLEDKRRYQAGLRARRQQVQAGHGYGPEIFTAATTSGSSTSKQGAQQPKQQQQQQQVNAAAAAAQ